MPTIKIRQGDQWVDANDVYVRQGDQWVRIGPNKKENTEDDVKDKLKEWLKLLGVNQGSEKRILISKNRMDLALLISILEVEGQGRWGIGFRSLPEAINKINGVLGTNFKDFVSVGNRQFYAIAFYQDNKNRATTLFINTHGKPGELILDTTRNYEYLYSRDCGNVPLFKDKSSADQVAVNTLKFLDPSWTYEIREIDGSRLSKASQNWYWYLTSLPLVKIKLIITKVGDTNITPEKLGAGYLVPTYDWTVNDFKLEI